MEFVEDLITLISNDPKITASSLLDQCDNSSKKGFIFEILWDMVIKFGFVEQFPRGEVIHLKGNFSKDGYLVPIKSLKSYAKETKIISSSFLI